MAERTSFICSIKIKGLKNTFFKIGLLIVAILLLLSGLARMYDFLLSKNCDLKISYVQMGGLNTDVLIHGPCEPLWMIYPKKLDEQSGLTSYNLALSHSDFADNYLHLYFYLKHNKAPKYLFLFVTPESIDKNYNTFHSYRFAPYVGNPIVDSTLMDNDPDYFKWTKIPFMRYAYYSKNINFYVLQGFKQLMISKTKPAYPFGYEPPFHVVWDNHFEEFRELYPNGYEFQWDDLREKYLRKSIELAQSYGVNVILYESPILKEALAFQPNRVQVLERLDSLAADYGVKYVRFQDMEMTKDRKYFTSPLNTSMEGAAVFTDSLGKYIKNLDLY